MHHQVQYQTDGFLEKNRDTVLEDQVNTLKASEVSWEHAHTLTHTCTHTHTHTHTHIHTHRHTHTYNLHNKESYNCI